MSIWEIQPWELIKAGGPIMAPIVLCSVIALAIILTKLLTFSWLRTNTHALKEKTFNYIKENKIKEAIAYCEKHRSPSAKILKAGLLKFGANRGEIKEALEDAMAFEIPHLEKYLTALATIAHISPLLGLLGTVTGMAGSFHTIQVRATSLNPVTPGDLAGSIWEALLTTVAGLIVAIPSFVFYNYFVSRVNDFILDMERTATDFLNITSYLVPPAQEEGESEHAF